MNRSVRTFYSLFPLFFLALSACDQDCDSLCAEDYADCEENGESDRCDAEYAQCSGTCAADPQERGDDR
jgi:hypothetical protein